MAEKNKALKWLLIIACIILLLLAGVWIWVETQGEKVAREQLPVLSGKATDSLYRAEASDVDIDLGTRDITLTDFELGPDAPHWEKLRKDLDLPPLRFSLRIQKLYIRHLSVKSYLQDKELVADALHIVNPVIRINRLTSKPKPKEEKPPPKIERIRVGSITIENPDIQYVDATGGKEAAYTAKGGSVTLQDWRFELNKERDSTRLFYASHTELALRSITLPDPKGLYRYTIAGVDYNQTGGVLTVQDFRITPRLRRETFYKRIGFQKEIYSLRFPLVRLNGLDWRSLLDGSGLIAAAGELRNGNINIFMDRVPPPSVKSKKGKFPHQLLMDLKLPVYLPRLAVNNGQFSYTERNYKSMQSGTVRMTSIDGAVTNVTNIPARIRRNSVCSIDLKGDFKGSTVNALFRFPLNKTQTGNFSVEGRMTAMDGTRLNDITKPLALADIRKLQIDGIRFRIDGSEAGAGGQFTFKYRELDVDLLEEEEEGGLGKKHVTSFVADNLLLFNANPKGDEGLRTARPDVSRDMTKSFFNLVWKHIFTGVLETVGRGSVVEKVVNRKAKKEQEKRKKELRKPSEEKKEEDKGFLRRLLGK